MPLLDVKDLKVHFHTREGIVRAVDGVSFSLEKGGTLGIVGESGSGKSVTCYSLLGLIPMPPGRIAGGTAHFDGTDLLSLPESGLRKVRGKRISMIFQDPMTCLNPFLRIREQLVEPLLLHTDTNKTDALKTATTALGDVGIRDPEKTVHAYPHEFSGGMRQRVMIAMALITKPELLIADEPTTALDVTIQKQVLDLIRERQQALGTAVIFITHDLAVVSEVCDHVNVMYAGRFVESARTDVLFSGPAHAYTRALQASIPALQEKGKPLYTIPGAPPNLLDLPQGCAFAPRANLTEGHSATPPAFKEIEPDHFVQDCPACLAEQVPK